MSGAFCALCAMPFCPFHDGHAWECADCQSLTPDERELAAKVARKPCPGEAGPKAEALRRAMVEENRGRIASGMDAARGWARAGREDVEAAIARREVEEVR